MLSLMVSTGSFSSVPSSEGEGGAGVLLRLQKLKTLSDFVGEYPQQVHVPTDQNHSPPSNENPRGKENRPALSCFHVIDLAALTS